MTNLTIPECFQITHEQFWRLAQANPNLRLERTATGELIIMPPTGGVTGNRNLDIEGQLWLWNRQTKLGKAFNSSTGFHLPSGADRSPDAAWITQERWNNLTSEEQMGFVPLCPDFVVELRSASDDLPKLQKKMQEYLDNGIRLGWLIDPQRQKAEIYKPNAAVQVLNHPTQLSGEDVLPGFILDLTEVWR